LVVRLLAAWLLVGSVGYWAAPGIAAVGAPVVVDAFRFLHPDLLVELLPLSAQPEKLRLSVTLVQAVKLDATSAIPGGSRLTLETGLLHALLPAVLLISLSLAMPMNAPRLRAAALLLALLMGVTLAGALLVGQWSGLLQLNVQSAAEQAGIARTASWSLELLMFLEGGARWLIALVLGVVPTWLVARWSSKAAHRLTKLSRQ